MAMLNRTAPKQDAPTPKGYPRQGVADDATDDDDDDDESIVDASIRWWPRLRAGVDRPSRHGAPATSAPCRNISLFCFRIQQQPLRMRCRWQRQHAWRIQEIIFGLKLWSWVRGHWVK